VTDHVVELQGVHKRYGEVVALGPVDIAVREGEFLTLLGPSGCGKTTTLHLIAGLLQPNAGRILMAGRDITDLPASERGMGVVFQSYALFPHKTVAGNIGFGLRMRGLPRQDVAGRVREMLAIVGLPGVEERYPRQLSGGQRQRVALARALVIHPPLLLLDEPLSNLDALLRTQMRRELRAIQRRLGLTAIYVTHDQEEAFEMSDRVVLLNQGRIEQTGSPEDLYDRPQSRFAAEFIGDANLIEGEITRLNGEAASVRVAEDITLEAAADGSELGAGDSVHLVVRPERIEVARERPASPAAFAATVQDHVFAGETVRLHLATPSGVAFRCVKPSIPAYRALAPGDPVWIVAQECRAIARTG